MTDVSDHDLLLEIRGDVKHLVPVVEDHEKRIRAVETREPKGLSGLTLKDWLTLGGIVVGVAAGGLMRIFGGPV